MVGEGNPPTAWQVNTLSLCVDTIGQRRVRYTWYVGCRFLVPIQHSIMGEGNPPTAWQVNTLSLCVDTQVDYGEPGIPGMLAVDSWCLSTTLWWGKGIPPPCLASDLPLPLRRRTIGLRRVGYTWYVGCRFLVPIHHSMVWEGNPPTAWHVTYLSLCVNTQVYYGE
jgi:hypothetical protein